VGSLILSALGLLAPLVAAVVVVVLLVFLTRRFVRLLAPQSTARNIRSS
jgi:hypothetical protein